MKRAVASALIVSMSSLCLVGCQSMPAAGQGAAVGAAAGGVLGAIIGGNRQGALIGAALGSLTGAIIADYQDKQMATRAQAAERYGAVRTDRLEIESASLAPEAASGGVAVESVVVYTTLAATEGQQIKIKETRTLLSGSDTIQLSSRDVVRQQGTHSSTLRFTLPKDIAKGEYTLVTIVSDGKSDRTVRSQLRVV